MGIDKICCISGTAAVPFFLGQSVDAFKKGSIPVGLVFGGAAAIATPFVLKYIATYFYPPVVPPPSLGSTCHVDSYTTPAKQKTEIVGARVLGDSSWSDGSSSLQNANTEKTKETSLAPLVIRSPSPHSPYVLNLPDGTPIKQVSSEGSLCDVFSLYGDSFGTPRSSPLPLGASTFSVAAGGVESTEDLVGKLLKRYGPIWKERSNIPVMHIFYLTLGGGYVNTLWEGTKSVKGISNIKSDGTPRTKPSGSKSDIIAALQVVLHNKCFLEQIKEIPEGSLSSSQKKLSELLKSLQKRMRMPGNHSDHIVNTMDRVVSTVNMIQKKEEREYDPVIFIKDLFSIFDANEFTLVRQEGGNRIESRSHVLQIPFQEPTLANNVKSFFSEGSYLTGPLPNLFVMERDKRGGLTKEVEVENRIKFSSYSGNKRVEKSEYKIKAAFCCFKEGTDEEHYVVFLRTEGKWLLCNDEEICEVSKPNLQAAYAYVFEKIPNPMNK